MPASKMPRLAVIMPNYNDGPMIEGAVAGILAQRYSFHELVIIDDGSTDNSREIIHRLAQAHSQIRLLENPENRGVVYSFNRAIEEIESEYVCFASMDDWSHPDWLQKSMELLTKHPEAGLCCSDLYHVYSDDGDRRVAAPCRFSPEPRFIPPREFANVVNGHYIAGTTVVVKRSALLEVGGYRPELRWHSDWFAWLAIAFRYGACYVPECLVSLRVRSTSHSEIGMRDWSQQSIVLRNILDLLNSRQFLDVVPSFIWGKVMNHFGHNILRLMMENPDLWSRTNYLLLSDLLRGRKIVVGPQ